MFPRTHARDVSPSQKAVRPDFLFPSQERSLVLATEAIYCAAADPAQWPVALQAIADVFGDVGALLIWRQDGAFQMIVSHSLAAAQRDNDCGWPVCQLRMLRKTGGGGFLGDDPFTNGHASSDQNGSDPAYAQFCARHGLGWFGAVAVSPEPHVGVALSVQRNAAKRPAFSELELDLLARIGRHVESALRLSMRLLDHELSSLGMREALSRLGIGVFALDPQGHVIFTNPAGKRLLGDGLDIVDDRLRAGSPAIRATINQAITRTLSGEAPDPKTAPRPMLIERARSPHPLTIYVLPAVATPAAAEGFLAHARAVVLAIDPQIDAPPDPAQVRDIFGLTLGEARVAALVGSGLCPREAAEKLGIAEATARTVLKRVLSKAGVSRQSELAALLAKLVVR